ncbi:MAG: NAD-dependent epimerase/dehydratase family protein [Chitinophagales bacterium]|nr:NAD-dependent epimerase/dehydratase family protein [Chitinophagales bacterium]
MINKDNRILVSGGSGFVGSYLIRSLIDKGYHVRGIRRKQSNLQMLGDYASKVEWAIGDVLDVTFLDEVMKDVDKVYHSAAVITFIKKEMPQMYKINIEGTANMVNAALSNGIEKFLHVSSISAFGRSENSQMLIDENTEWRDGKYNTNYAITKHNAEREVWRAQQEGLNTVIMNPATILGACDWSGGTGAIFKKLADGLKFYTTGMNGFVDVRDVVEIAYRLMESDISNERFIVSSQNIEFMKLFELIAKGLNIPPPKIQAGPFLNGFAWRMDRLKYWLTGIKPVITPETARMASHKFKYDNSKLKSYLNYEFIQIEETVALTCAKFLESKDEEKGFAFFENAVPD